jgi:hypothetical protein
MKRTLAVICLLMAISVSAAATTIMGQGLSSCGKWSKEQDEIARLSNVVWVVGYISGMNRALNSFKKEKKDVLENTDLHAIESAIDKFCLENPLKQVSTASEVVFLELLKTAR